MRRLRSGGFRVLVRGTGNLRRRHLCSTRPPMSLSVR